MFAISSLRLFNDISFSLFLWYIFHDGWAFKYLDDGESGCTVEVECNKSG